MAVIKILDDIRGLSFVEQVSFAAGDPGSGYSVLRASKVKLEADQTMLANTVQVPQNNRGPLPSIAAGKGGKLSFSLWLRGGETLGTPNVAGDSEAGKLIRNCGFTRTATTAKATSITAASASSIGGTDGNYGVYVVGDPILVKGASTATQLRWISREQSNAGTTTLTIEPNFSVTPSVGDSLYAVDGFVFAGPCEPSKYLTFRVYQGDGDLLWTCTGCAGTWKIDSVGANALPMISFEYQIDSWVLTAAALAASTDTYSAVHPLLGDAIYLDNTALATAEFAFDPGVEMVPLSSYSGANGREGWFYKHSAPKIGIKPYFDIAWWTGMSAGTTYQLAMTSIKNELSAWGVYAPAIQVVKLPEDAVEGIVALKPEILVTDPGSSTEGTEIPLYAIAITGDGT